MIVTRVEPLDATAVESDTAFHMDEDTFRAFYERTARGLWLYLMRISGDEAGVDDLLQEAYYRFLRAGYPGETDAHQRHYLFQIATNLVRDARRRRRIAAVPLTSDSRDGELLVPARPDSHADDTERRTDLARGFAGLRPRERALVWLAYVQGATHREIAETLGLRTGSVKMLLFRARRKMSALIRPEPRAVDFTTKEKTGAAD
jgi:RNA polymerase sigma-70 factor, ECF subfamily